MDRIVQFGVARSGSTLIYLLLKKFLKVEVIKSHDYIEGFRTVCTYRDFRDSALSYWRVLNNAEQGRKAIRSELKEPCNYILYCIKCLNKYKELCPNNCLFLRYRDFVNNMDYIADSFEKFFNIIINKDDRLLAYDEFSFENNKKISDNYKEWLKWDPDKLIHGGHLYKGEVGTWKEFIKDEDINYINDLFYENLKKWDFEI